MVMREYRRADRAGCLAVFDSNVPDDFRPSERASFEGFLDALPGPYLVLEDGTGRVVGCGGWALEPDGRTAALCWGMVERSRQGEGLGRRLLEERLRRARRDPAVECVTLRTSHRVRGFFARLGFVEMRGTPDGIAPGLHEVEMAVELRADGPLT